MGALASRILAALLLALASAQAGAAIRFALWHAAPVLATSESDIDANTDAVIRAMHIARENGASWFITPELALTGYRFADAIGTDWMQPGLDQWTRQLQATADELDLVLVLGHVERTTQQEHYNTAYVFGPEGRLLGKHRKINTIPVAEDWAQASASPPKVIEVDGVSLGLLICADAWPAEHARALRASGAELIVSPANWWPGEYGPGDTWQRRVRDTGVPLLVNNRTGIEGDLDMTAARSVLVVPQADDTLTLLEHVSANSELVLVEFDIAEAASAQITTIALPPPPGSP